MTTHHDPGPIGSPMTMTSDHIIADIDPIRREAYEWIARFMGGEMAPSDIGTLKAWYGQSDAHRAAYAEARRVWHGLGPIASESMGRPNHAGLDSATRTSRLPLPGRRAFLGGTLAASAAYLMVRPPLDLWPSYTELMADFRTGIGERRQVALADGVALDLNTRTSITVRSRTPEATQIELLSGETVISTGATPAPLVVIAGTGRIVATEAEFDLRCDGNRVAISCLKGHLTVQRDGLTTPLSADQQVSYGLEGIGTVAATNPETVTAWQRGLLIFDALPVAEVVAEVNRYRKGHIVLMNDDIGRRLLNARLRIAEVDKIIVQIVHIFGAKARELPGGIVLLT